jgi:hypothetical protein
VKFFDEWDDYTSEDFGTGYVVIPSSYFDFVGVDSSQIEEVISALKNFVNLKVYGVPRAKDLIPQDWNEIISVNDAEIIVERERSFQEELRSSL